jgi:hypothetical protein
MDGQGRLVAQAVVQTLNWRPGTPLTISVTEQIPILRAEDTGIAGR